LKKKTRMVSGPPSTGSLTMPAATTKAEARKLVESLSEDATWEDLMYQIYVRQAIEEGIRDADEGRLTDTAQVRAELGLSP